MSKHNKCTAIGHDEKYKDGKCVVCAKARAKKWTSFIKIQPYG